MSCYVCNNHHIAQLAHRAKVRSGSRTCLSAHLLTETAYLLLKENYRSVCYRYPSDEMPGEDLLRGEAQACAAIPPNYSLTLHDLYSMLSCYRYQACEHPEWETSQAYILVSRWMDSLHAAGADKNMSRVREYHPDNKNYGEQP